MPHRMLTLLALLALLSTGAAQQFGRLLPSDSFLALGMQDIANHEAKVRVFLDELERQGVLSALSALFPNDGLESSLELEGELPPELEGVGLLDLLGQEAWVAVSASSFSPLPSVTLLTRTAPKATAAIGRLIAGAASEQQVQALAEGDVTFYQAQLDTEDFPNLVAYAQVNDVLTLSTNPDTLRGVLRRLAGSGEPNLASSEGYASTFGRLGSGNFYLYLDYAAIAALVTPLGQGLGLDKLVSRLGTALDTAGTAASVVRITATGFSSEGAQALNSSSNDPDLLSLLSNPNPVSREALAFAPATALSFAAIRTDLTGWWDYLNDLTSSTLDLEGDLLNSLIELLGIDLRSTFFDWAGSQVATISTGAAAVVEPGVAVNNLLGETVYLIETTDPAAAQAGLDQLLAAVGEGVAAFSDPSGGAGNLSISTRDMAGVKVTRIAVIPGMTLSYAVADNFALIATSANSIDAVLSAFASGVSLRPTLAPLLDEVPSDARSFTLADTRATLENAALQLTSQLQLTAGLGGASNLDFDAVMEASQALERYLLFVASRLGGSLSYSQVKDDIIFTFNRTEISW
ncbi:MAG: hypothetical protein OXC09_11290 [Truepera sp.]|nr:hypothetical protein [Truepera sp.]